MFLLNRSQTSKPPPPINAVVGPTTTPEVYPHSVPYSNFSPYSVPPPTMQQPPPSVPPPPPAVPPPQSNSWGTDTNKRPFDPTIGDQFSGEKKMRSDFHNPGLPPDRGRWIGDDHNKIQDLHNKVSNSFSDGTMDICCDRMSMCTENVNLPFQHNLCILTFPKLISMNFN